MKVHFLAAYYPQSAHTRISPRTSPHWDSYRFCQAVKTGLFSEDILFPWKNNCESIKAGDSRRARNIFGLFIKKKIFDCGIKNPIIVPVPSKDAIYNRRDFRSYQRVREALEGDVNYPIVPALRFTEKLSHSYLGGPREVSTLYSLMSLVEHIPNRDVVLVDDIITTGASIRASYRRISESNLRVSGAVVCGCTVYKHSTPAFGDHQMHIHFEKYDERAHRSEPPDWH